ncbi:hypothetical protein D5086_029058 [Populus alba]|uniref:Uncharacterized protein n=1 Tax=Populus alba TaxID=43335 RepID=A0ACC4ASH0_POPAL
MLQHGPKRPLYVPLQNILTKSQHQNPIIKTQSLSQEGAKTPQNPPNRFCSEKKYGHICDLLLSQTRSRSLLKGQQIHAHIIKSGLQVIPLVCHYLINFYSKTQLPLLSRQVFEESERKSSTTWSSVISSFAQNEEPVLAIQYFCRMIGENLCPDDHIFPSATKACAILGRCDVGKSVHCLVIKTGYDVDVFVGSSLVDMYAKCGDIKEARNVFDEMPQRNVVSWSGMIYGYTQLGEHEEAMRLFKEALLEGLNVNDFTLSSVIRVCGSATLLELGKQIHGLCFKTSYDLSGFVAFAADKVFELGAVSSGLHVMLSNAYAAAGRYEDAAKARKMLRDRGVKKETGLSWIEEGNRVHKFAAGDRFHVRMKEIYQKLEDLGEEMERAGYVADTSFVLREVGSEEKNQTIRQQNKVKIHKRHLKVLLLAGGSPFSVINLVYGLGVEEQELWFIKRLKRGVTFLIHHPTRGDPLVCDGTSRSNAALLYCLFR